jgi:SAM-dependent methyltransferase
VPVSADPAPPLRKALQAQVFASVGVGLLIQLLAPSLWETPLAAAALQGIVAALLSYRLNAPPWWLPIHLLFMPMAVVANTLPVPPLAWLAAFGLLLLVFWRTDRSRVPLYLTNNTAARALADLLPATPGTVIDCGCGDGGLLRQLARLRPDCQFVGIEHAPLPWLWARIAALGEPNILIRYGDFWKQHLGLFDLVYVFLSPAPMPQFWEKAGAEMKPGALLVSNSFAVPGESPERVIEVEDRRRTRLYCYRPVVAD